jgi:hypothetical protein
MRTPILIMAALALTPLATAQAIDTVATEPASDREPWIADYEGTEIDLRFGWDTARACATDGVETTCYDTEAEMTAALGLPTGAPETTAPTGTSGMRRIACDSYLRLYTGTNYTGSILALTTRGVVLNLSSYGFNNVTSSYRIGGCSSTFWDLSSGGAPVYGGATWAWASASAMNGGWDNRVSSVYIA